MIIYINNYYNYSHDPDIQSRDPLEPSETSLGATAAMLNPQSVPVAMVTHHSLSQMEVEIMCCAS